MDGDTTRNSVNYQSLISYPFWIDDCKVANFMCLQILVRQQ